MSSIYDQVVEYTSQNPGVIAAVCLTVLVIGITQIVLTTSPQDRNQRALTEEYAAYPLVEKITVSHNTRIFRFQLPSPTAALGLPLGRHISLRADVDGKQVRRPYTPISSEQDLGHFELLVKVYPSPGGLMSRHLDSMAIGDTIDVRGPLGKFVYARNSYTKLCMVCGGTGITPMWQVFKAILRDNADTTQIALVFANVGVDDILLKDQLDELAEADDRFTVNYVLNNPPQGWQGGVGFVSKEMLTEWFGKPSSDKFVMMCGPPPMNKAMKAILSNMGYSDAQVFKF